MSEGSALPGSPSPTSAESSSAGSQDFPVVIDGIAYIAARGEVLAQVLERNEIIVPQVCRHPSLGGLRTCDTCMVEVDGTLQRACTLPVRENLRVAVDTEAARHARREAMQRILANHELYCTVCDYNNGDCEVHNAADQLGLTQQKYPFTRKGHAVDDSNPFYRYDPDQCVLCARCVEACQNVQVTETLSIDWTAEQPRVLWDGGRKINDSSCVSCGHCVTVCPCNALLEKSMIGEAGLFTAAPRPVLRKSVALVKYAENFTGLRPLFATSKAEAAMRNQTIKRTKTVCTFCGVGCAFEVWTKGRTILKIQPHPEAPANGISTCVKGKFGWDFVNSAERLVHPLIRREGKFQPVRWEDALDTVARRLRQVADTHGPDSVAFIASSKITNEECYLVQKLARAVFGTNNVDNCARYCQSPASKGLSRTVGYGGDSGTMNDIEQASLVLIIGSNTSVSHPVLASRIKRRVKLHGQRLIVSDLRAHDLTERAHIFLRPKPGTDLVWINAVARLILEQGREDRAFIAAHLKGFDEYRASLDKFTLEWAAEVTGLAIATLQETAREIATAERVCGLWAMGVTQHIGGSDTCTAICNLLLLTGNFGRPGTGAYPLRGHNNVQGSCDFGALYNYLPGYGKVGDDEARGRFEKAWGRQLPAAPGLNNRTMIEAAHDGKLKALFVVGEELALVDSNANHVQEALRKLEFMVVQDIFFSTTAKFADVVLAAAPSLEKEGTFVNTERRIQRLHQALDPLGESRPDWRILSELAAKLGHEWNYASPGDIMNEVAGIVPEFAGVRYDRLDGWKSLCWPVDPDGRDQPLLYTERFHSPDGKASFFPVDYTPPTEPPTVEYPFHLNNGRVLEHFHEGNLTYRVPGLKAKIREAFVEMCPADADELGLHDGDWVQLESAFGRLRTQVVRTGTVRPRECYMPVCSTDQRVNLLSSSHADPVVDTPAYKEIAVKITKLGERNDPPVPRGNPRHGRPTPQTDVKVEEKWARGDYRSPDSERPEGARI